MTINESTIYTYLIHVIIKLVNLPYGANVFKNNSELHLHREDKATMYKLHRRT